MEKKWWDYRMRELEEKSNLPQLPKYDMDGCYFHPDDSWFESNEYLDFEQSISERLDVYAF